MSLKDLTVLGLKSFGNKTRLNFQPGVAAIVVGFIPGHARRWFISLFFSALLLSGLNAAAQAVVTTDQTDYAPGDTVLISGSGFASGETIQLQVFNLTDPSESGPEYNPWTVTAASNGTFTSSWVVTTNELGATLQLTATGLSSGLTAQTEFMDGAPASGAGVMTVSPTNAIAGMASNSFVFTFTQTGTGANGAWGAGSYATLSIPAGWTAPQTNSSTSAGFIQASPQSGSTASITSLSGSGPWVITIAMTTPHGGGSWTLTYTNVTAPTNATTYTFTNATDEGAAGSPVNITNSPAVTVYGAPSRLVFTADPSNTVAGQILSPMTVQVEDAYGNFVPTNNVPVTVALSTNAFSAGTNSVVTDTNGQASFTNLVITAAANGYTVTASASNLTSAVSTSFNVTPASANASNTVITASPTSIVANGSSTSAITVTEKDIYGNKLTSSGVTPVLSTSQGTLGSVTNNNNGTYSTTLTSSTAVGTASVTGTLSSVAIGTPATVLMTASSTLSLVSSTNPAPVGTNVVFTATISPVSPSTGTPTGSVHFLTNGVLAVTTALSSGSASYTNSTLPHATNTITATYGGDTYFLGSTNTLSEVINNPPVAGIANYSRPTNATLIIPIANLLTNASDPNGDPISLVGVSAHSTNNATVSIAGSVVAYQPPATNGNVTDTFNYTVKDSFGATNTGLVVVTIQGASTGPSMNIVHIGTTNGVATVTFAGIPGYQYFIQASTNLTSWVTLSTNSAGTNGLFQFLDTQASNYPVRYYRTVWQ